MRRSRRGLPATTTTSDSGTLQWVELMGMPTFDATSTVSALITSMQNPLQRQTSGETERWKTDGEKQRKTQVRQVGLKVGGRGGGGGGGWRGSGGDGLTAAKPHRRGEEPHSKPCRSLEERNKTEELVGMKQEMRHDADGGSAEVAAVLQVPADVPVNHGGVGWGGNRTTACRAGRLDR